MNQRQRGSGALMMVLMLLLMSAALLNATRQQVGRMLSQVADEREGYQQMSLATSALNWGKRQRWPEHAGWQCKESAFHWRACLLQRGETNLLSGDSGVGTQARFQWVSRVPASGLLSVTPHGWLDYCPLANEKECLQDE